MQHICYLLRDYHIGSSDHWGHSLATVHMFASSFFFFKFFSHSSLSFQESPVMTLITTIQMEIHFSQSKHYVYKPLIVCNLLTCTLPRLPLYPPWMQILSLSWVLGSSSETDKSGLVVYSLSAPWNELKAAHFFFSGRSLLCEPLAAVVMGS